MNTPTKFAGFGVGIAALFGAALGIGAAIGPDSASPTTDHDAHGDDHGPGADQPQTGMLASQDGYTLSVAQAPTTAAADAQLGFRILDAQGQPVTQYATTHDKDLHMIVVRRDMSAFQHVHPVLDDTGTWQVPLDFSRAGDYRIFADFVPAGGDNLVLGTNLNIAGEYAPAPLAPPASTTTVDGYTVALNGSLTAGQGSMLTLSVSRDGQSVTDLQPYLGAYGHLVALRSDDLAYLHVHPTGTPGDGTTSAGPEIGFHMTPPTPGDYRLYLDFKHGDVVRTAEFTVSVPANPTSDGAAAHSGHGN